MRAKGGDGVEAQGVGRDEEACWGKSGGGEGGKEEEVVQN